MYYQHGDELVIMKHEAFFRYHTSWNLDMVQIHCQWKDFELKQTDLWRFWKARLWSYHSVQGYTKLRLGSDHSNFTPKTTLDTEPNGSHYVKSLLSWTSLQVLHTSLKYKGIRKKERAWWIINNEKFVFLFIIISLSMKSLMVCVALHLYHQFKCIFIGCLGPINMNCKNTPAACSSLSSSTVKNLDLGAAQLQYIYQIRHNFHIRETFIWQSS